MCAGRKTPPACNVRPAPGTKPFLFCGLSLFQGKATQNGANVCVRARVHTRERVQNPWSRASRRTAGVARLWVPPGPPGRCAFLCRDSLQPEESGPAAGGGCWYSVTG